MSKTQVNTMAGRPFGTRVRFDWARHKWKYLMILPVLVYLALFCYRPMYGVIIAFKNYRPTLGIAKSKWVGFGNFAKFFRDYYFPRIMRNTVLLSLRTVVWGFPMPILLALALNELRGVKYKRVVQTVTYIPHFISLVVVCAIIRQFSLSDGVFNDIRAFFGMSRTALLQQPAFFPAIYVASGIWQQVGWSSIIYLAAITAVDPNLYEAAEIDGAGRLRQVWHITIPGILPTIVILLILRMGSILSVGYEKIILLYNESIYETADVISTYTYRRGLIAADYSYGTAIGLFNSVVNIFFLLVTNRISRKVTDIGMF